MLLKRCALIGTLLVSSIAGADEVAITAGGDLDNRTQTAWVVIDGDVYFCFRRAAEYPECYIAKKHKPW